MLFSSRALARSWPNGFSMTTRRHWSSVVRLGQAGAGQLLADDVEVRGRDGQVERVVAAGALSLVELVDGVGQPVERVVVGELARHEPEALGELPPGRLAERRAGVLPYGVVDDLLKSWSAQSRRAKPTSEKPGRQQPPVGQVVDGGHQLLAGQVARDAEDHQAARPGDARQPLVPGVSQRVAADSSRPQHLEQTVRRRPCGRSDGVAGPAGRARRAPVRRRRPVR